MAKIELPGSWADVAEPLRALMAEFERETQADSTAPPDPNAVAARSKLPRRYSFKCYWVEV